MPVSIEERLGYAPGGLAAVGISIISAIGAGLAPALLGALNAEHRLSTAGIGYAASLEIFVITIVAATAGILLRPRRLRMIALVCSAILLFSTLATTAATVGWQILVLKALAGVNEGLLSWIAFDALARAQVPERAAAFLMVAVTVVMLATTAIFSSSILPRWGVNGGLVMLAGVQGLGIILSRFLPDSQPDAAHPHGRAQRPPARALVALTGGFLYNSACMGFVIYVTTLAAHAGLSPVDAGIVLTALIGGQLLGAIATTILASRLPHLGVIVCASIIFVALWPIFTFSLTLPEFAAAAALFGFVMYGTTPFYYPLVLKTDSTRGAAILIGPVQMLGSSFGPFLAGVLVARYGVGVVIPTGIALIIGSAVIAIIVSLGFWRTAGLPSGAAAESNL